MVDKRNPTFNLRNLSLDDLNIIKEGVEVLPHIRADPVMKKIFAAIDETNAMLRLQAEAEFVAAAKEKGYVKEQPPAAV